MADEATDGNVSRLIALESALLHLASRGPRERRTNDAPRDADGDARRGVHRGGLSGQQLGGGRPVTALALGQQRRPRDANMGWASGVVAASNAARVRL